MTCKPEESPNARSAPDAASVLTLVNPVLSQFELTGKPWASWALLGGTVLLLGLVHLLASLLRPAASVWSVGESGVPGRPSMPAAHIVTSVYKSDRDHYCCYQPDSPACDSIPSPLCWCPNPQIANSPGFLPVSLPADPMASSPVVQAALGVAHEFDYPSDQVQRGVQEFIREMHEGLSKHGATLSQIPSYVTSVPNGTEKGLYLAVDLGGTNFRVCSVQLHGDSTFSLTQSKVAIPRNLMVSSSYKELFKFIAKQIEAFLEEHHNDHFEAHVRRRRLTGTNEVYREEEIFDLGFTFSFPVNQVGINRGTLIRWTKGFDIPDAIGKDVCLMLQEAIDELHLPIRVAALVNDTVGTLMARSYTSPGKTETLLGAIFGTGTNGAYVEKLSRVTKLDPLKGATYNQSTGQMVVNTEWGSFDNHLSVLPTTVYDRELDADSVNPGVQMFEKRVSGMFLGEILRRAILALNRDPAVQLLQSDGSSISPDSDLYKIWGIDTSFLSKVEADETPDLQVTADALKEDLKADNASLADRQAIKALVHAIGKRAARLSAVPLGAILIESGRLETDDVIDIGVDGSLVEFYPKFVDYIREALREIPQIGEKEQKVRIGIAKDGSGVGAALIALVAKKEDI
ncbi:hypothetical protein VTN96DRAFT_3881 [Rasamsonia emersonii]|uniref:Phosphotransferase n=1 Tax=Rasamsonia emersonii (strain ATCC 16479 / CBS 393.64 / IMI 116815) TaxID=1408163 RepID=A0A0F4YM88_RASE3|nr:Glucokinase [Rasamsonia emersonii CBS 393.64]KKA18728.1 Glucokinase [Rasamsonia emersonii CBS 393.64]